MSRRAESGGKGKLILVTWKGTRGLNRNKTASHLPSHSHGYGLDSHFRAFIDQSLVLDSTLEPRMPTLCLPR